MRTSYTRVAVSSPIQKCKIEQSGVDASSRSLESYSRLRRFGLCRCLKIVSWTTQHPEPTTKKCRNGDYPGHFPAEAESVEFASKRVRKSILDTSTTALEHFLLPPSTCKRFTGVERADSRPLDCADAVEDWRRLLLQ